VGIMHVLLKFQNSPMHGVSSDGASRIRHHSTHAIEPVLYVEESIKYIHDCLNGCVDVSPWTEYTRTWHVEGRVFRVIMCTYTQTRADAAHADTCKHSGS
jgi:hypothetical protein